MPSARGQGFACLEEALSHHDAPQTRYRALPSMADTRACREGLSQRACWHRECIVHKGDRGLPVGQVSWPRRRPSTPISRARVCLPCSAPSLFMARHSRGRRIRPGEPRTALPNRSPPFSDTRPSDCFFQQLFRGKKVMARTNKPHQKCARRNGRALAEMAARPRRLLEIFPFLGFCFRRLYGAPFEVFLCRLHVFLRMFLFSLRCHYFFYHLRFSFLL